MHSSLLGKKIVIADMPITRKDINPRPLSGAAASQAMLRAARDIEKRSRKLFPYSAASARRAAKVVGDRAKLVDFGTDENKWVRTQGLVRLGSGAASKLALAKRRATVALERSGVELVVIPTWIIRINHNVDPS
jgi:hypothetical protein